VISVSSWSGRLRQAVAVNTKAPTVWLTAAFALVGFVVAAGIAGAVGLTDVALPAGFVAAIAGVAGGLVPPGLTRQVTVPACIAVALAPALALAVEGRPVLAGSSTAAVNRLLSTLAGAAVGLLATVLIPVPRPPEQPVMRAPADPEAV